MIDSFAQAARVPRTADKRSGDQWLSRRTRNQRAGAHGIVNGEVIQRGTVSLALDLISELGGYADRTI